MPLFKSLWHAKVREYGNPCCVGLDPHAHLLPRNIQRRIALDGITSGLARWGCDVIDALYHLVPAIKPQSAFFEAFGPEGMAALKMICLYAKSRGFMVILDGKRGDIGSTAEAYARASFEVYGADAVTVNPFLGPESLTPYIEWANKGKGIFVLLRTTNSGAHSWQSPVRDDLMDFICQENLQAVVGATLPEEEVLEIRQKMGTSLLLAPGIGAQGAGVVEFRRLLVSLKGYRGAIATASRSILFPRNESEYFASSDKWASNVHHRASNFAKEVTA